MEVVDDEVVVFDIVTLHFTLDEQYLFVGRHREGLEQLREHFHPEDFSSLIEVDEYQLVLKVLDVDESVVVGEGEVFDSDGLLFEGEQFRDEQAVLQGFDVLRLEQVGIGRRAIFLHRTYL